MTRISHKMTGNGNFCFMQETWRWNFSISDLTFIFFSKSKSAIIERTNNFHDFWRSTLLIDISLGWYTMSVKSHENGNILFSINSSFWNTWSSQVLTDRCHPDGARRKGACMRANQNTFEIVFLEKNLPLLHLTKILR